MKPKDTSTNVAVIALVGPTGAGKSNFIDAATAHQEGKAVVGHNLQPSTTDIRAVEAAHPSTGRQFIFLDTPGIDEYGLSDVQVLDKIKTWLNTNKKVSRLGGIIYLHRISDNRMTSNPTKNLSTFEKLCGHGAIRRVVLATTMWAKVKPEVGTLRESQLKEKYWNTMLSNGSAIARFLNTPDSAWGIVEKTIEDHPEVFLLAEEWEDLRNNLGKTHAGTELCTSFQRSLAEQRETVRKIRAEGSNSSTSQILQKQYEENQEKLDQMFQQLEAMKVPLSKRILMFFTFRRNASLPTDE